MSKKFLVPVQLPGNPANALEATPKQYVDALGKQTNSATPPSSPVTGDLWFHTDDGILLVYHDSYWVECGANGSGPMGPTGPAGTLADGSVTTVKIADGAVTPAKQGLTTLKIRRVSPIVISEFETGGGIVNIVWDTEDFDSANIHNMGTGIVTLVSPGIYQGAFIFTGSGLDSGYNISTTISISSGNASAPSINTSVPTVYVPFAMNYYPAGTTIQVSCYYSNYSGASGQSCTLTGTFWLQQVMV